MSSLPDFAPAVLSQLAAQAPHPPFHLVPTGAAAVSGTPLVAPPIYQLLYTSQAQAEWSEPQLIDLLEQARQHNQQQAITGVLLYQNGCFIQFLEGEVAAVQALYARIQQDLRHHHVVVAHQHTGTTRFFADWSMAYATPDTNEFYWLLDYIEARQHRLLVPRVPITEPYLLTLLEALQQCC